MEWRYIKGFEGYYKINIDGEIMSIKRNIIMKQQLKRSGYLSIKLCRDGGEYHRRIHRLLAETFLDNPNNKPVVNHIDGNKSNNSLDNLEWATISENTKHAYDMGLFTNPMNIDKNVESHRVAMVNRRIKLNISQLKQLYSIERLPVTKIAIIMGVSGNTIHRNIKRNNLKR